MKKEDLIAHLTMVNKTFGNENFPALNGIYIKIDGNGKGEFRTSNGHESSRTLFTANIDQAGEALIDGYTLSRIVGTFSEGDIILEKDQGEGLKVTHPTGDLSISGMSPAQFPEYKETLEDSGFVIPAKELTEFLDQVHFARVKKPGSNQADMRLSGIGLVAEAGIVTLACTDRKRIAKHSFEAPQADDINIVLAPEMLGVLKNFSGNVAVRMNPSGISFETNESIYQGAILSGVYPSIDRFFPDKTAHMGSLDLKPLLQTLERISILARGSHDDALADFHFLDTGHLALSYSAKSGKIEEKLEIDYQEQTIQLSFDVNVLMEGLKKMPTEIADFMLHGADSPVVFHPKGAKDFGFFAMAVKA